MYKILRLNAVIEKTGLAKSTVYKKIGENEFPKQFSLGGKAVGWLESDIDKWIKGRILIAANDNGGENFACAAKPRSCMELVSVSKVMVGVNDNIKVNI